MTRVISRIRSKVVHDASVHVLVTTSVEQYDFSTTSLFG